MALAVAEQFPGVQECWEAAQSHVDIGSGQACYETRWEMGNKVDLNFPPSVCTDQEGVQGVVTRSHGQFGSDGTRQGCTDDVLCTKGLLFWLCSAQVPGTSLVQENSLSSAEPP